LHVCINNVLIDLLFIIQSRLTVGDDNTDKKHGVKQPDLAGFLYLLLGTTTSIVKHTPPRTVIISPQQLIQKDEIIRPMDKNGGNGDDTQQHGA
jgi:hypothetical protein